MLRSLVGSEMCIRDRKAAFRCDTTVLVEQFVVGREIDLGVIEQPDGTWTCLLYTSDAADDLLCVDIGGRRIIKKKKEHTDNNQSSAT